MGYFVGIQESDMHHTLQTISVDLAHLEQTCRRHNLQNWKGQVLIFFLLVLKAGLLEPCHQNAGMAGTSGLRQTKCWLDNSYECQQTSALDTRKLVQWTCCPLRSIISYHWTIYSIGQFVRFANMLVLYKNTCWNYCYILYIWHDIFVSVHLPQNLSSIFF